MSVPRSTASDVGDDSRRLDGKVALVAGATRGCGRAIAVELAAAGAHVYATGRSSRIEGPSEIDRPETIEETGEAMAAAGGSGVAVRVDHLDVAQVERSSNGSGRSRDGSTSWSTTSSEATGTPSGRHRCGNTTSPAVCACSRWASTPT